MEHHTKFRQLIITSIDQKAYFKDLDIEKLTLSIYAWDSAPKTAYKNYPLSEPLKFPLILDLKSCVYKYRWQAILSYSLLTTLQRQLYVNLNHF